MTHATLTIEGMTCEHCVTAVREAIEELGAEPTRVEIGVAEANYDEAKIDERAFADAIEKAGYELKSFDA